MATIRLNNPKRLDLSAMLARQIGDVVRTEIAEKITVHKIERPAINYWRGRRGTPRVASSVASIPDDAFKRLPVSIGVFEKDGGASIIADAAVAAAEKFRRLAPVATGNYRGALKFRLNGRPTSLQSIMRFAKSNPFSERETISLYPAVAYASSLESAYARRAEKGIVSRIARELLAQFGQRRISVQFTYVSGVELGLPFKYMVPLLTLGGAGAFPSRIRNPGANRRRRKRREARAKRG